MHVFKHEGRDLFSKLLSLDTYFPTFGLEAAFWGEKKSCMLHALGTILHRSENPYNGFFLTCPIIIASTFRVATARAQ